MRKVAFINKEFYHIYNRGTEKRNIFEDKYDVRRFFQSMKEFNVIEPIGSIYEMSFKKNDQLGGRTSKLVESENRLVNFICHCLNKNHYHFLLEQVIDNGISEFMKRLGGGYTMYFNGKYKRSGALFQGKFKSSHINSNEYLLHVSTYINLNDRVHSGNLLGGSTSKSAGSSWKEYIEKSKTKDFCKKDIILGQFNNKNEYKDFAINSLESIIENKDKNREIKSIFLE